MADQEQDNDEHPFHVEGDEIIFDRPIDDKEAARQRRESEQHEFARSQVKTNRRIAVFTGLLVFATFCTIGVGIWQAVIYHSQLSIMQDQLSQIDNQYPELQKSAQAARDAADVNKEALYSVQRAFVTFAASPSIDLLNLPSGLVFMLKIEMDNGGATIARSVKDRVSCVTPMNELPENYAFPDEYGGKDIKCGTPWAATGANTIPAKGNIISQSIVLDTKMVQEFLQQNQGPPSADIGRSERRRRAIEMYGWVTYRDIFKDSPEHLTEFCRRLSVLSIQRNNMQAAWTYCPIHNCTDDDCADYRERIKKSDAEATWFKQNRK